VKIIKSRYEYLSFYFYSSIDCIGLTLLFKICLPKVAINICYERYTIEYIANTPIDLNDEQLEEIEALIDKLEEDDDVQNVYTNIN